MLSFYFERITMSDLKLYTDADVSGKRVLVRVQLVDGFDLGHGALLSKRETSLPRQARFGECC